MSKLRQYGFIPGIIIFIGLTIFYGWNWYAEASLHQAVRVHFIANSDLPGDQHLKLQVRDRVLATVKPGVAATGNRQAAVNYIENRLPQLQTVAANEVKLCGYNYPVKVALGEQQFGWRTNGGVIFSPGAYTALTVTIGQGKGHNWWGVIYPPFGLVSEQTDRPGVELRCKIWDLAKDLKTGRERH